jgi:hypothetical protein
MIKKARIILALLIAFSLNTSAQTFNAGICAGPVVTQYNGDNVGGYNKIGPKAGIFVHRDMPGKLDYQLDLIFVQKGSKYENTEAVDYYNLRLRYLELPITFQYITDFLEIPGLFRLQLPNDIGLELGLGAAYLLEAKEDDDGGGWLNEPVKPFKPYDITAHAGLSWYFNENWWVNFRYSYSILPIREHPGGQTWLLDLGQYNNVLHFTVYYAF